jgi:hypothetical protein
MTLQKATQILRDRKKILDAPRLAYLPTAHSQGLDLGAIGLSRPAQYHEVDPIVSNDLINIALRAREYFIEALNQIIPGLRVPKMMAGDVNTLPFDLVQLGPGRLEEGRDPTREYVYFSMERLSVRKDQGGQAEFEFTPPIEGLSSEEVIVGIQKNKAGYLEQPLPFDYGTLYKIAQVIRRANGFGDAEIVFTKPQIKDGEIILEAHFVYSGARNGWHHQGRGIRPLSIHQQRAIFDATRALQVDNRPILPSPYEWFIQKNSHGIIQGIGISGPIPLDSR